MKSDLRKDIDALRDDLKQIPRVRVGKVAEVGPRIVTIMFGGERKELVVTGETIITINGKSVKLSDLKPGGIATVTTDKDGNAIAINVKAD